MSEESLLLARENNLLTSLNNPKLKLQKIYKVFVNDENTTWK